MNIAEKSTNESASGAADFDFLIGSWKITHRRLKERMVGSNEWVEFIGESTARKILGGMGNIEDSILPFPGDPYRAIALRSYDAALQIWSIWWLDGRHPGSLDVPVTGRFVDGEGLFYAEDTLNGKPIRIRFHWLKIEHGNPRWEQAFSDDDGASWEVNWTMDFTKI